MAPEGSRPKACSERKFAGHPGNAGSRLRAGKDDSEDYNAGAVECAYQCEGERFALSLAAATTVKPSMAMANVITKVNFLIMTLPGLDHCDTRLLDLRARSWFLSVN